MSAVTFHRDQQARELLRTLSVIAVQAREMALDDGTSCEGSDALRALASAAREIASQAGVICHADAGGDLGALADNLSDICAAIVRSQHTPTLSQHELAQVRADHRSKEMREQAA